MGCERITFGLVGSEKTSWKMKHCIFIAAPFTITKTWKQPKCPLTKEWLKKMWYIYIYIMEDYSIIKKSEIMPFAATWMDLETVLPTEVSQTEEEKHCMAFLTCGI